MTFELSFVPAALKEWEKLTPALKEQFRKKLKERLKNPHVPTSALSGYTHVYKIKLKAAGYRLVYEVVDRELVVYVLTVGKREKGKVYQKLKQRSLD